jgi:hypothetical protein
MTRRQRRVGFSYAPAPLDDETLGSWVQRIAWGQETCGSLLVGRVDIDWSPSIEVLRRLAEGSGQPIDRLRAMALDKRYPGAARTDFARSDGVAFPGCHAFCPICARRDLEVYGHVVLRARNAGFWRLTCGEHRCLLDSVESEDEITPHRRIYDRGWLDGRIRAARPASAAAPVALAFERAIFRASSGRSPGLMWLERDPAGFKAAAIFLATQVLLVRRDGAGPGPSPAWALLGARMPDVHGKGMDRWDESFIRRAPSWLRVRAMTACARLLLEPRAAPYLGEAFWWTPPGARREHLGTAWSVASGAMTRTQMEALRRVSEGWSSSLKAAASAAIDPRLAALGCSS